MMEWQPIETAPKDGTWFHALNAGGRIPFVTAWDEDDECWFTFNRCFEETIQKYRGTPWQPTHWMPLPEAPKP